MPRIKTKKLMVRGGKDREWNDIPSVGPGVYPVTKTNAMTQPVGRDEQGRLFTAPGGTGGTGTVTSVAGVAPDETGNVPLKPEDIGAADTKKVDELSEAIAEKVTTPAAAEVGQMLVVETVDDTGKPLTWKVIPAPDLSAYLKKTGDTLAGKIVLPTGNQNVGFINSQNLKIFGYGNIDNVSHMRIGDASMPLQLRGSDNAPKYNSDTLVLQTEFEAALGSYITDIDALIGGEA